MKSSVNEATAKNCPTCSRPLPSGAPAGLCPACLLAQGAETESGAGGPQTRFVPPTLAEVAALFPQLEILRLLGAGGMGAVYQARQPALDRFVALKVLPAGGDGVNFEERFNREARALARLSHPNIVAVHEFGQAGAQHYFLMEFVDGANLRQLEQAGRLSPREALQIIPQICDALQYAHDEGVVHRDIKPENVLVDRKGRVKIADFGLAKILGHDPEAARLTVEGQVMGTPHYMAPEQVERPLAVDHRADIYSLGVVFYEMLTGDLPLGKFAPPSRKVQVDVRLDEIVLRALENDPARRYQQASEVKSRVATVVETPAEAKISTPATDEAGEAAPKPGVRYLRWLGIPAVVERDGEREVNFQGALGVFFVMLMTGALAQQAVRWVTGTEYATTQLGFVTASMMAIWAIRRTMNRPWDDEPPRRAANGTVILPPTKRRRYVWDGLMVVGLLAFTVGSHFLKTQVINPRLGIAPAIAPITAKFNPQSGVLAAQLRDGGTVELIAVADASAAPDQWWRPDGVPETTATYTVRNSGSIVSPGKVQKDVVFNMAGLPADADGPYLSTVPESFGSIWGGEVSRNGRPDPALSHGRIAFWPDTRAVNVVAGFCVAPWQTVATYDRSSQSTQLQFPPTGPRWSVVFHQPDGAGTSVSITYVFGPQTSQWKHRLVALDGDGAEHTSRRASASPTAQEMVWSEHFDGLSLERITEFRLQVRPVETVMFENVALRPNGATPARQSAAAFGQPTLLSFGELVDFDLGHAADFPPAEPGSNPFAGIGENILWAQENGFDAVAGAGKLDLLGVTVSEISDAEWEAMTPAQAEARLAASGTKPHELTPQNPDRGTAPAYAVRTREGGVGLIRFLEFRNTRTGFTVQFRNAVRPGGAVEVIHARRDGKTGELVGRLPGRGVVTLSALRPAVAGMTEWWRPDGRSVAGIAPHFAEDFARTFPTNPAPGRLWQLLLRAEHLPSPEDHLHFEFPGALNRFFTGGAVVPRDGANPGAVFLHALWPNSATNAAVRVGVPMAQWHTIRSYEPLSRSFTKTSLGDDPRWTIEMHTAGVGTKGAQITVVFGTNYPGWNLRVLATRLLQTPAVGVADVSVTNGPAITRTFVFPELKALDAVQNFQVQAQPVQWVGFADLNLAAHRSRKAGDVSPASFRHYFVGRSWEELGQSRNLSTPEQAVASFGLRLLSDEDQSVVLAETTLGLPKVSTKTLAYRSEPGQAERLRRQQVVSVVVCQERLAAVILSGKNKGTPVFVTLVTGLRDGQWKVLPRFGSGLKTSFAVAEAGFQKNARQLLERFESLPSEPEVVPAEAAAETVADAIGSLLRSLVEATTRELHKQP